MSRTRSGTQTGFSSATVTTTQSLDLVESLEQPDGRRYVSHDLKQVGIDVLASLLVTLLRRTARLVEVHVPLRRAFDDRSDASRAAQVVFEVEPTRRVEARGQQVVQRAPIETRRTYGLPVVAGRQTGDIQMTSRIRGAVSGGLDGRQTVSAGHGERMRGTNESCE